MAPNSSNCFSDLIFKLTHTYQGLKTITKLAFLFFLSVLLSCNNSQDMELPEEEMDQGNEIVELGNPALTYRNHCGGCHGQDLASFVERDWTYGNSVEDIIESITRRIFRQWYAGIRIFIKCPGNRRIDQLYTYRDRWKNQSHVRGGEPQFVRLDFIR